MAGFGQNDEVVSKPSASSWGGDDEVVTPKPTTSKTEGGAAFGVYPRPGMEPGKKTPTVTALGAAAASAGEAVAATPGVLLGARAAMAVTPPVAPVVGPFAKPIAGIVGGIAGGALAQFGITSLEGAVDKEFGTDIVASRQQQQKEYPVASTIGQVAGGGVNPFMRPGMPGSVAQAAFGGGVMGVVGAGQRAATGGDILDPTAMAIDVGMGVFTKPTKIGERLMGHAAGASDKPTVAPDDLPPKPTAKSTPEERAAFIKKMEEIKAKRDSTAPLEQAAIRNIETGNIELMGPKHDPVRKADTKDTHEEGFIDSRGNFHERQAAVDQAKRAGQIPQDHVLENPEGERPGLHSGDLRKVGDQRFAVTEDQPAGVAKPPVDEPKTRAEHFKDVQDLEHKLYTQEGLVEADAHLYTPEELATKNKELDTLRTQIEDMRKNAPQAVVADKMNPTNAETHEILAGAKTVGEGLKALVDGGYGGKGTRWLANKLGSIGRIADASLTLDFNNALLPPEGKVAGSVWEGAYYQDSHSVHLYEDGRVNTFLHEAVHAGTIGLIRGGGHPSVAQLNRLFDHIKANASEETIKRTYGLTSMEEMVAEVYTNKKFIDYLKSIPGLKDIESGNAWAGFKRIIMDMFDAKTPTELNILDQVLEHSSRLMEAERPVSKTANVTSTKPAPSVASDKFAQEQEKTFWDKVKEVRTAKFAAEQEAVKAYEAYRENPTARTHHLYKKAEKDLRTAITEYHNYVPMEEIVPSDFNDKNAVKQYQDSVNARLEFLEREQAFKQSQDALDKASKKPAPSVKGSPDEPASEDRTKVSPRDVKDEAEFREIAADIYEKHGETEAVKFYEGYEEYKRTWLEPVKETEKFVGTNIKNKLANDRIIHNEMSRLMESVPDAKRREAIAIAVDKGDLAGLTKEEVAVAKKYEALAKDIGDRAVEQGVVKGLLEDYVTHILDWAGAPKGAREEFIQTLLGTTPRDPSMRGMTTESKFGKERKFKTFAGLEWFIGEANKRIEAAGKSDFRLKIKTKDIAEIYKEYALSMEKAIENKRLVDNLKQVRNEAGETLIKEVSKDMPKPEGWVMMDSPQFAGYAVHPDMVPALKFVFDAGPGDLMKAFGAISQLTKRINVIGSFFHAKSLMEVLSSSQIPLWTPVKEAIVLPLVEKGVKALTGKELQLSAITKAVDQFKAGGVGDNVDMWIKEGGLQLEMPEDVSAGILSATGKFADSMIGKYGPKTRVLEKSLSTVEKYTLGLFDNYTWNFLHTGGKIMVADAYLDKARMTAAKEGKLFDETASRKEISKFVNDSFGGLNWFDAATQTQNEFAKRIAMAAYNPAGRRGLQVALFAPDWTLSTLRAFTAALPKELNPTKWHPVEGVKGMMTPTTKADYARLYQFKTALTYFTLLNAINMMTANRPIWENKDPTRIEWPDGTSMQAMKHAMEPYHWLMDADKTFANKLGFIPKAVIVGVAGTEYASPQAQKLVDPSATGRLKAVAGMVVPFQVAAARDAPPGEGVKRAALGTMGFPIYGSTKEQKKASRAEREKQLKEAAKKYHIKAKEKGWEK